MPEDILSRSPLFAGIEKEKIGHLCACMGCTNGLYHKNDVILLQGDRVGKAGILLSGSIRAESSGYSGEQIIQSRLRAGDVFGDALMAVPEKESPVSIIAEEETQVLFLPFSGIMNGCEKSCPEHQQVRLNLMREIAEKFWGLNRKVTYLSIRFLRGRIAEYLHDEMKQNHSQTLYIPYTREELAALLGVNRSALSRELSRMAREGLISVYRNSFRILQPEQLDACRAGERMQNSINQYSKK